jgi:hypothetical protein
MAQSDPVLDAASKLLSDLMPLLKQEYRRGNDEPMEIHGMPRWSSDLDIGPGIRRFKAVPMVFTAEQQRAARVLGELRAAGIPQLTRLDQALAADPTVGPRLDHQVSSIGAGGQTWQGSSLIQLLVDYAIKQAGGFDLGSSARDLVIAQWVEALRRKSDRVTVIVALHEFHAPIVPIVLEPSGLQIDELRESEIAAALALGGGQIGLSIDEHVIARQFGIRASLESRLFVDDIPPDEGDLDVALRETARERAQRVVLALRVFKAGRVGTSGGFDYTTSFDADVSPKSGGFGPSFGWHAGGPYVLGVDELPRFLEFWSAFEKVHSDRAISSALRRFGFAADRSLPEDEIVDLMIAAESLFLIEIGTKDRGEFRFRVAARAASLLGDTLDERLRLSKFMRHAYDARSAVVHGGTPKEDDLRDLSGGRVSVRAVADDLQGVLRRGLRTAIDLRASGKHFPPDWETLMLAGPRPRP